MSISQFTGLVVYFTFLRFCSQVNCVDKHLLDFWSFVFSFVLLADSLQILTEFEVRFSPFCCQLIVFTDTGA